jgi:uncharacterized SAM-binding protein YcdF (DUF218 family)
LLHQFKKTKQAQGCFLIKPSKMKPLIPFILVAMASISSGCKLVTHIQFNKTLRSAPYEVVIVPGFPYNDEQEKVNFIHRLRIFWAHHLVTTGVAGNIIFSGSAVHTPYVEAEIMAQYARSLGIPDENIFVETRAEHSTENLFYGYALARELGFSRIAVATDPFQSQLIKRNTTQDDLDVDYIAAKATWTLNKYKDADLSLADPCAAYVENFVPLAERISKEERKLGTAGERFRKRYNMKQVTAEGLAQIDSGR